MHKLAQSQARVEPAEPLINTTLSTTHQLRGRTRKEYLDEIAKARWFYKNDAIAGQVVNRIVEIANQRIIIDRNNCTDEEFSYFNYFRKDLKILLDMAAIDFLVNGMAVADYLYSKVIGNRIHAKFGRRKMNVPMFFLRDAATIVLKRHPASLDRRVFVEIPPEEAYFIRSKGVFLNGTEDRELYLLLVNQFPEYVQMVERGITVIPIDVKPMYRNLMTFDDYPQSYLTPAIPHLAHKNKLKEMDYNIASRALEAIRLIRAGNDQYPITEDDNTLEEIAAQIQSRPGVNVYNLFANHTVSIEWVFPPLDILSSPEKYQGPDLDIFTALGFSRALLTGEAIKSNTAAGALTFMGPVSIIKNLQNTELEWVRLLFEQLAEENNFDNIPLIQFQPIHTSDMYNLLAFAMQAVNMHVLSREFAAKLFGASFKEEEEKMRKEQEIMQDLVVLDNENKTSALLNENLSDNQQEDRDINTDNNNTENAV